MKIRVLFVCLGNICRSPAAEAVFRKLVEQEGLSPLFEIDSAGTSAYHAGESADGRMRAAAQERGFNITSISRGFDSPKDFLLFDYILTMDEENFEVLQSRDRTGEHRHKLIPIVQYCVIHQVPRVPDPYYGGDEGFRLVLDILEDACRGFLTKVREERRL